MRAFIYECYDEDGEIFTMLISICETAIKPDISRDMLLEYLKRCKPKDKVKQFCEITNEGYNNLKPKFLGAMKFSSQVMIMDITDEMAINLINFMKSGKKTVEEKFYEHFEKFYPQTLWTSSEEVNNQ